MRHLLWIVLICLGLSICACHEDRKIDVLGNLDPNKMPTMRTLGINTIISDSGITKYRIVSPEWLVYDATDSPVWRFPKGLYLQQFDQNMKVIGSVACDSAIYYKNQGLWRLDGNVEMHNNMKDLFLTKQLFWDQQQHKIYSDSFIHIERIDRVLEGEGFESNERLTTYRIIKPKAILPANLHPAVSSPGAPEEPAGLPMGGDELPPYQDPEIYQIPEGVILPNEYAEPY